MTSPRNSTTSVSPPTTSPVAAARTDGRRSRLRTVRRFATAAVLLAAGSVSVAGPLDNQPDRDLRRVIRETTERETAQAAKRPVPQRLTRVSRLENLGLKPEVLDELNRVSGLTSYLEDKLTLGMDLLGENQEVAPLTLERAIKTALNNNLNVEFARLAPAISQNQITAAEAAFDWVLFNNTTWNATDQPRINQNTGFDSDSRNAFDTAFGARKSLISGGQVTVQHQFVYTDNNTPRLTAIPDPARETNVVVQLDQPLLRGFGSEVALAQVRLARNTERDEIQQLKSTLIQTATDTEVAYWNLVRARNDLLILQRLQARGEEVLDVLRKRRDAKPANVANAGATVEGRRADVIRGRRVLREASDQLKLLMNDPVWTIGSEVLMLPVDSAIDQPIEFSLVDSINSAFVNRPEVHRAVISMDNTSIRRRVADNARLPQLNLRALSRFNGLGGSTHGSYDVLAEGSFVDYQLGVQFEMPIGNRAAESNYSTARKQQMQANQAYRNTLQSVVREVKSSLRDIVDNYELIEQERVARIAAAEDVRQLRIEEETTTGLTPDFLDLKLRRQESLAASEQAESRALTDYAAALAQLHAACGTALERNRVLFDVPRVRPDIRGGDLFPDYMPR